MSLVFKFWRSASDTRISSTGRLVPVQRDVGLLACSRCAVGRAELLGLVEVLCVDSALEPVWAAAAQLLGAGDEKRFDVSDPGRVSDRIVRWRRPPLSWLRANDRLPGAVAAVVIARGEHRFGGPVAHRDAARPSGAVGDRGQRLLIQRAPASAVGRATARSTPDTKPWPPRRLWNTRVGPVAQRDRGDGQCETSLQHDGSLLSLSGGLTDHEHIACQQLQAARQVVSGHGRHARDGDGPTASAAARNLPVPNPWTRIISARIPREPFQPPTSDRGRAIRRRAIALASERRWE